MEKVDNILGYAPIWSLIKKFALPSVISMLVMSIYNITDQIFIGNIVGILGNASTNIAFPTVTLASAAAQMAGIGTASNFNINLGAGRKEESKRYIGNGITLVALFGIIYMSLVLLFKSRIVVLFGATPNIVEMSETYLGITAIGFPVFMFSVASGTIIRADGSPKYAMFATTIGAVLNVFLDWLFMYVFKWGIAGAAGATVVGQTVSFICCLIY